ncbi:MAG: ATP-binding protein [Lachnospiraceae bacterium]|nr:ATP-binding protein [Lachnospiraceae bacterium]
MGSGKSFLSCCLANSIRIKYNLRCRFVSAVDYLAAVGDGYDRKGEPDPSAKYRECDLLILDDLGAHKSGEWQVQEIFRLIDERMKASLAAIITANMPLDGQKIGERTVNRIYSKCVSFHLPEESIRAKIAQAENEKFLAEVLGKK